MSRMLLRPGWLLTHALVLAIAVGFISLGVWQVDRHFEQQAENERIAAQLAAAPVPADVALDAADPDLLPVTATGRWLQGEDVQLSPRSRNERPGLEVLTPLRLDSREVLLVNRGWVPLDAPIPPPEAGEVTLSGRLRTPTEARRVLTDDDGRVTVLSSVDPDRLAQQVADVERAAYMEIVDEEARQAGVIPRPADPVLLDAGPHLSYAAQWFAFTVIGLVGYPLLIRRRLADAAGGDPPDRPAHVPRTDSGAPVASTDPP